MGFDIKPKLMVCGLIILLLGASSLALSSIAMSKNGKWNDTQKSLFMNWCRGGPSPNPIDISVFVSRDGAPLDEESRNQACSCIFTHVSTKDPAPYFITRKEQGYRSLPEGRRKDLVVLVIRDLLWDVKRIGKAQCSID